MPPFIPSKSHAFPDSFYHRPSVVESGNFDGAGTCSLTTFHASCHDSIKETEGLLRIANGNSMAGFPNRATNPRSKSSDANQHDLFHQPERRVREEFQLLPLGGTLRRSRNARARYRRRSSGITQPRILWFRNHREFVGPRNLGGSV